MKLRPKAMRLGMQPFFLNLLDHLDGKVAAMYPLPKNNGFPNDNSGIRSISSRLVVFFASPHLPLRDPVAHVSAPARHGLFSTSPPNVSQSRNRTQQLASVCLCGPLNQYVKMVAKQKTHKCLCVPNTRIGRGCARNRAEQRLSGDCPLRKHV